LGTIAHAMNGAKVPNWAKLVVLGVSLGWVGATQVSATRSQAKNVDERVGRLEAKIDSLRFEQNLAGIHDRLDLLEYQQELADERSRARDARLFRAVGIVDDKLDVVVPKVERLNGRDGYRRNR